MTPHTSWTVILVVAGVFSVGQGITFTAMFATAGTGTPEHDQGTAGGIATTGQQLGGAIGLAVLVNLTATATQPTALALYCITAIVLCGLLVACAVPHQRPAVLR